MVEEHAADHGQHNMRQDADQRGPGDQEGCDDRHGTDKRGCANEDRHHDKPGRQAAPGTEAERQANRRRG